MVRQAVGVEIHPEQPGFRPGGKGRVTLRLTNAGAGHKIPTGDPDRYFTVEFELKDPEGKVVRR
jgi:hypothetical protein